MQEPYIFFLHQISQRNGIHTLISDKINYFIRGFVRCYSRAYSAVNEIMGLRVCVRFLWLYERSPMCSPFLSNFTTSSCLPLRLRHRFSLYFPSTFVPLSHRDRCLRDKWISQRWIMYIFIVLIHIATRFANVFSNLFTIDQLKIKNIII